MKQFCDVVVWEKPAITVSYRTGMTVFEAGAARRALGGAFLQRERASDGGEQ